MFSAISYKNQEDSSWGIMDTVFCCLFAFSAFVSMRPYILWQNYFAVLYSLPIAVILIYLITGFNKYFDALLIKYSLTFFFLQMSFLIVTILFFDPEAAVTPFFILYCLIPSLFLAVRFEYRIKILEYFITLMTILFFIGIIEYFLSVFNFISPTGTAENEKDYAYYVYYFTVMPEIESFSAFYRFCFAFNEPGVVGTFCGLVLFIFPKINFKFYVFLFAGIISFSLAFYTLLFLYLISHVRINVVNLILIFVIFQIFLNIFGAEVFDSYILSRLGNSNNNDIIQDNRTSPAFDNAFNELVHSNDILFGRGMTSIGRIRGEVDVCSWKMLVYTTGIIGFASLIFLIAWSYFSQYKYSLMVIILFVAYMAALYQRAGFLLEVQHIIILYGGGALLYNKHLLKESTENQQELQI